MKVKLAFVAFLLCLLVTGGCDSKKEKEEVQPVIQNESNDIPSFVKDSDFENINWDKVVGKIDTNEPSDMIGNKNKVGFIGPELEAKKVEKWLWHFWGISSGKLTVVGYNKETSVKHPVLIDGWSKDGIGGGKINGADASMPSNVSLPEAGKWALLVYVDEKLFDTLVIDVKEN